MRTPLVRKILVPVDLSKRESPLRDYAIGIASQMGAELLYFAVIDSPTILHLIESHPSDAETHDEGLRAKTVADAKVLLRRMVDRAAEAGVRATGHAILSEKLRREVIREAKERGVDLILVGSAEGSAFWRLLIGDSAEEIMHRAPCPVLCYRSS
ncbi:MAG: universal stress protein [Planctomycetota bacterium]